MKLWTFASAKGHVFQIRCFLMSLLASNYYRRPHFFQIWLMNKNAFKLISFRIRSKIHWLLAATPKIGRPCARTHAPSHAASLVGFLRRNPGNPPIKSIQFPARNRSRVRLSAMKARGDIADTPRRWQPRISVSDRSRKHPRHVSPTYIPTRVRYVQSIHVTNEQKITRNLKFTNLK